jgi:hypothetical protein
MNRPSLSSFLKGATAVTYYLNTPVPVVQDEFSSDEQLDGEITSRL